MLQSRARLIRFAHLGQHVICQNTVNALFFSSVRTYKLYHSLLYPSLDVHYAIMKKGT